MFPFTFNILLSLYIIHKNIWEVKYSQIFFMHMHAEKNLIFLNMPLVIYTVNLIYFFGHRHPVSN